MATILEKKEYLTTYYRLRLSEKNLELELDELIRCRILPHQIITGMPGAHTNKDLSDLFVLIEREKKKYLKQRYKAVKAASKIIQAINRLDDETEKSVLIQRHILCKSWNKVAQAINYSRSRMFEIYNSALEHLIIN